MQALNDIDKYLSSFPKETQEKLEEIRKIAHEIAPEAKEKISYGVPTITVNGKYLVYFAGFKKHISIYPVTEDVEKSVDGISKYRTGKGTLQFPINKPPPLPLIRKIIQALMIENKKRTGKDKPFNFKGSNIT